MSAFLTGMVLDLLPADTVHFGWYGFTTSTFTAGTHCDVRHNWAGTVIYRDFD